MNFDMQPERERALNITGALSEQTPAMRSLRMAVEAALRDRGAIDPERAVSEERCLVALYGSSEKGTRTAVFHFQHSPDVCLPVVSLNRMSCSALYSLLDSAKEGAPPVDTDETLSPSLESAVLSHDRFSTCLALALGSFRELELELDPPMLTPDYHALLKYRVQLAGRLFEARQFDEGEKLIKEFLAALDEAAYAAADRTCRREALTAVDGAMAACVRAGKWDLYDDCRAKALVLFGGRTDGLSSPLDACAKALFDVSEHVRLKELLQTFFSAEDKLAAINSMLDECSRTGRRVSAPSLIKQGESLLAAIDQWYTSIDAQYFMLHSVKFHIAEGRPDRFAGLLEWCTSPQCNSPLQGVLVGEALGRLWGQPEFDAAFFKTKLGVRLLELLDQHEQRAHVSSLILTRFLAAGPEGAAEDFWRPLAEAGLLDVNRPENQLSLLLYDLNLNGFEKVPDAELRLRTTIFALVEAGNFWEVKDQLDRQLQGEGAREAVCRAIGNFVDELESVKRRSAESKFKSEEKVQISVNQLMEALALVLLEGCPEAAEKAAARLEMPSSCRVNWLLTKAAWHVHNGSEMDALEVVEAAGRMQAELARLEALTEPLCRKAAEEFQEMPDELLSEEGRELLRRYASPFAASLTVRRAKGLVNFGRRVQEIGFEDRALCLYLDAALLIQHLPPDERLHVKAYLTDKMTA